MYNFVSIGGTSLSRLQSLNQNINIVSPDSIDDFKKYIDLGYHAIINGLTNNRMVEWEYYLNYIEQNKIPLIIDALYESNVMRFHLPEKIDTYTTLLISNLHIKQHSYFDKVITVPYFLLQSYILWDEFIDFDEHLVANKKSFLCLNGVSKLGRRYAYDYFRKHNLINECIFSFHNRSNSDSSSLEKYPTIHLQNDTEDNGDGITWDNTYKKSWFLSTYFNFVTESTANNETSSGPMPVQTYEQIFFPTEKTFKPIANCHPFITLSDFEFHKNLQDILGFEIYDEIWDYNFDTEIYHEVRWDKILDQVKYISNQGIDYNVIKEKLIYNQQLFLDKKRNENILTDFLNQIDNASK